jgi:hypothetical protein
MDILWPALGISAIVCFVFYVLAAHWQRVLRRESWVMRELAERVRDLEEVSDPDFRRRLDESSPMPLEQVLTFSFYLSERFWRGTLGLSDADWNFVRTHGSFVGSVKLERWRSHTAVTVTEALPASQSAKWQKRSFDFYPEDGGSDALTLWELRLGLPGKSAERPPSLELLLRRNGIELRGNLRAANDAKGEGASTSEINETTFFSIPFDTEQLAGFRSREPQNAPNGADGNSGSKGAEGSNGGGAWRAFYSASDEGAGFDWQLRILDLARKAEWDRWRILDPVELGRG